MLIETSAVQLLLCQPYSPEGAPDPLLWGQSAGKYEGAPIHKLMVLDPETNTIYDNVTVAPELVEKVPAPGTMLKLTCEVRREQEARHSIRTQRSYVATKDKWRAVGLKIATAAGQPAAAAA